MDQCKSVIPVNSWKLKSRDIQGTVNALCYLIYAKYSDLVFSEELDSVFLYGDSVS